MTIINNASQLPKRWFGLHFCEGVAQYDRGDGKIDRILIGNDIAKKMDKSFEGKPVYVGHQQVDVKNIQNADGYVVRSFFNTLDGKFWVEFLTTTDNAYDAIVNKKWRLSNSYVIKNSTDGGRWHNVEYNAEVADAEYNHLAIVEKPRYDESVILTPDEYKDYCAKKESDLKRLQNSLENETTFKEKNKMKGLIEKFKKFLIENESDLDEKKEEDAKKKNEETEKKKEDLKDKIANDDSEVEVGKEKMTVGELKKKYANMCSKNAEDEELKKKKEKEDEDKKKNEADEEEKKKKEKEDEDKKKNEADAKEAEKKLNEIKNAMNDQVNNSVIETSINRFARGKRLYGSNN